MAQAQVIITAVDKTGAAVNSAMGGMNKLGKSFSALSAGVGSLLGVGLAAFFLKTAKEAIHLGDELQKAADKTGLSASKMSELAYVAKISDIELSSLSVSLKKMQVALSEAGTGSKGPNEALTALGLNFKELKSLAADQQFTLIAQRISELKDPADRARAATDLFGKSGAELLPLFMQGAAGITKLIEEAHKLGAVLTDEQVAALSETDQAVKKLSASWDGFANSITAKIAPALTMLFEKTMRFTPAKIPEYLNRLFIDMGQSGGFPTEFTPYNQTYINKLRRSGATGSFADSVNKESIKTLSGSGKALGYGAGTASRLPNTKELNSMLNFSLANTSQKFIDEYENTLLQLTKDNNEYTIENSKGFVGTWQKTTYEMSEYAKSAAQSIQSAFADFLFDPFQNGLRGMLAGFANIIRRMVAEAMAARIIQSSGLGAFLNAFMGVAVPAGVPAGGGGGGRGMALGGPVSANSTYMVGERGPEMFVPRSAGTIIPNSKMNGTTIAPVYNIDARGASADMQKALPAIMAENNRKIFDELDRRYGIGR